MSKNTDDSEHASRRKFGIFTLGLVVATFLNPTIQAQPADPSAVFHQALAENVDSVIDRAISDQQIVGMVVLISHDREVVYHRAGGYADRESEKPMTEDALFRYGSVTKPYVNVAVLSLVERGVLSLDDPVTRWLPAFRPRLADGREPEIMIRHLLTHTAGLSYTYGEPLDSPYHDAGVSDGWDDSDVTLDENMRRIASAPLVSEPGSTWKYSVAHDVLGAVISKASGESLPDAMRSIVIDPLGLSDTDFFAVDAERLTTPYADGDPAPVRMEEGHVIEFVPGTPSAFSPERALNEDAWPSGGGGMVGTAHDVVTLLEAIRTGAAGVIEPETAKMITTAEVDDFPAMPGWAWGLGVPVLLDASEAQTPQSPGTFTWGGVWGHHWFVDPEKKLTLVAMTNTTPAGMIGPFPDALRDAVYASYGD